MLKRCQIKNLTSLFFFVIIYKREKTKGEGNKRMKYQLINPINKDYNIIEQILTNRGIPLK